MQLRFMNSTANIKVDDVKAEDLAIRAGGFVLVYCMNGKEEIIGTNKNAKQVQTYMDRIAGASKEPDAKICYVNRYLERLEIVYGDHE